jgi:hypothetical protein
MRHGIVGLAVVAALSAAAGSAWAGKIKIGIDPISDAGTYNPTNFNGGSFVVKTLEGYNGIMGGNRADGDVGASADHRGPAGPEISILSFCLEIGEYISPGGEYWTEIGTTARRGGNGGNGTEDPLHSRTARIYAEFRSIGNNGALGSLFGGVLGTTLNDLGTKAIQEAIWHSENELGSVTGLAQQVYDWADDNYTDGELYDVRVLRLWTHPTDRNANNYAQDQLTLIPLPPAAWAGLSTLAGVGFVGYIRRRKNTAQ